MKLEEQYRVWAEIDTDALRKNYRTACRCAGSALVMPVIKADAYGHGAVMAAKALRDAAWFGVAAPEEALDLRQNGVAAEILLLSPAPSGQVQALCEAGITLCLPNTETARRYTAALPADTVLRAHIKLDTGMTRLGLPPENAAREIMEIMDLPRVKVTGLMSHFACADDPEDKLTNQQTQRFEACLEALREAGIPLPLCHCANSAAVLSRPETRHDMVRAGIMLYGSNPMLDSEAGSYPALWPVMSLKTSIVHISRVRQGQGVSYGHGWRAKRDSVIATVSIGYADGLSRRLSGQISMLLRGQRVPQAGRICMDMCMLDVTGVPEAALGDTVTVLGRDGDAVVRAEEHAAVLGTIPYEIFCAVGRRVPRIYKENGAVNFS